MDLTEISGTDTSMPIQINDSAVWRTAAAVQVNDSGTWRTCADVKVNDGGTWRVVFQNTLDKSVTVGGYDDGFIFSNVGFATGAPPFGSMASDNVAGAGLTITYLADRYQTGTSVYSDTIIVIAGFGADPGQSFFHTMTANSKTLTTGTYGLGLGYGYSAGSASWSFNVGGVGFGWNIPGNPWPWTLSFT